MDELLTPLREFFTVERMTPLAFSLLRIIAILIAAAILAKLASRFVRELRIRIVDMMERDRVGGSDLDFRLDLQRVRQVTVARAFQHSRTPPYCLWRDLKCRILQSSLWDSPNRGR